MKCPICCTGDLAWAWTMSTPEFRVGKGRCQNFDCCAEFIITRAADEVRAQDEVNAALEAAKPITEAVQ
jgi:hypothetical protein